MIRGIRDPQETLQAWFSQTLELIPHHTLGPPAPPRMKVKRFLHTEIPEQTPKWQGWPLVSDQADMA